MKPYNKKRFKFITFATLSLVFMILSCIGLADLLKHDNLIVTFNMYCTLAFFWIVYFYLIING